MAKWYKPSKTGRTFSPEVKRQFREDRMIEQPQVKFIPVIEITNEQELNRVIFCCNYHDRRMLETSKDEDPKAYERHRQIWKECVRRINQFGSFDG